MKSSFKKLAVLTACALAIVIGFAACEAFTPDALSLANKTFVYTFAGSSHYKETFVFDGTGKAGTMTIEVTSYQYGSAADAATNDASKKSWIQTGGSKATFTYDPATFDYAATVTQVYDHTAAAAAIAGGGYTSYSWQTVLENKNLGGAVYSAASSSSKVKIVFTTDNIETAYQNLSGSGTSWTAGSSSVETVTTVGGVTTTTTTTSEEAYDVSDKAIAYTYKSTKVVAGPTTTTTVTIDNEKATVSKWFTVGTTGSSETFSSSWVDGNKLSFLGDYTEIVRAKYTGNAPTVPTTFVNGVALTGVNNVDPYYRIDRNQYALSLTFEHHGKYILSKWDGATRHL